jgi:hypothetical protein
VAQRLAAASNSETIRVLSMVVPIGWGEGRVPSARAEIVNESCGDYQSGTMTAGMAVASVTGCYWPIRLAVFTRREPGTGWRQ